MGQICPTPRPSMLQPSPGRRDARIYIFVIEKVPFPLQPVPFSFQVPEMVFPFAVPVKTSVPPPGVPDTLNPNVPVTLPLKLPLSVNVPVSVSAATRHGEADVNLKLLMASVPSPFTTSDVPMVKMVALVESIRVAVQVPLMLAGLPLCVPHPA